jgi:hypothetical protein
MFFRINNKHFLTTEQLRADTLLQAYYAIKTYPIHATEVALSQYIQQQYKKSLKDLCIELLLNLKFCKDDSGNLIALFDDKKYDDLASLITYGNGALHGCGILTTALNDK